MPAHPLARCLFLVQAAVTAGCAVDPRADGELEQAATVCAGGETLAGIDVSKWQGDIDWDQVAGDGVTFAFIRVNHGLDDIDEKFAFNWAEARRVGVVRGAYQYFLPDEDAAAQAELFLERMGPLAPGDLPPVLDVENTGGGMSAASIAERVGQWMERVEPALGVRPILYTGKYFWQDNVASSSFADHPLWIAYWDVTCPDLPAPWTGWTFHQTSDNGSVAGIAGDVDTDVFNGSREDLAALGAPAAACGDGECSGGETPGTCGEDCPPCAVIPAEGGAVDDTGPCFTAGGPPATMRVENAGYASYLRWTHTTALAEPANYGQWDLTFAEGGRYRVEAHTPAPWGQSRRTVYQIRHAGQDAAIEIDQSAIDGWTPLGDLDFAAGGGQSVRVDDNTGEPNQDEIKIVFDAIRFTRLGGGATGDGGEEGDGGDGDRGLAGGPAGCAAAGRVDGGRGQLLRLALWLGLGLLGLLGRRRN
jgi:GH25 family lysozyme M1 (1,4-beta-N-acetylmuramidase)